MKLNTFFFSSVLFKWKKMAIAHLSSRHTSKKIYHTEVERIFYFFHFFFFFCSPIIRNRQPQSTNLKFWLFTHTKIFVCLWERASCFVIKKLISTIPMEFYKLENSCHQMDNEHFFSFEWKNFFFQSSISIQ